MRFLPIFRSYYVNGIFRLTIPVVLVGFFTVPNNGRPIEIAQAGVYNLYADSGLSDVHSFLYFPANAAQMVAILNADSGSSFLPVRRCPISRLGRKMENSSTLKAFTNSLLVKTRLSQRVKQDMWFPSKRGGIEDDSEHDGRCRTPYVSFFFFSALMFQKVLDLVTAHNEWGPRCQL